MACRFHENVSKDQRHVSGLTAREMLPGRRMGGPRGSMRGGWPDNERFETSTIRRNAINELKL